MANLDLIEQEVNKTIASSLGTPVRAVIETIEEMLSDASSADKEKAKRATIAIKTCILASTNIRDGAVSAGSDRIVTSYPCFTITGTRSQRDTMNFSAIRLAGHILNSVSGSTLAMKLNSKAGNILTGMGFNDGKAGKINQETFMNLTADDKDAYADFSKTLVKEKRDLIDTIYKSIGV